jgi:Bacterial archaeo-eukaryotic release factor family 10
MLNLNLVQSFSRLPQPVLTAYLNANPAGRARRNLVPPYSIWLKTRAKRLAEDLDVLQRELFQEQANRVEKFLSQHVPRKRGLLIFAGPKTWELVAVPCEVKNELQWGKPALAQLFWTLAGRKPYGAVVIDRSGVRFFHYWLGEMAELERKKFQIDIFQWRKKELGHFSRLGIKKTRGSQRDVFDHRMEAQYRRICRETARTAKDLVAKQRLAAIFLVGPDRLIQLVQESLPQGFRRDTVLVDQSPGKASLPDLQQKLETWISEWERRRTAEMVDSLFGKDPGAVVGLDETLARLQRGEIRALVVSEDLEASLHRCATCGWTDRSADPVCSRCGGQREAETLRGILPEMARTYDVDVEVIGGRGAERLKKAGGLAGRLRRSEAARFKEAAASKT